MLASDSPATAWRASSIGFSHDPSVARCTRTRLRSIESCDEVEVVRGGVSALNAHDVDLIVGNEAEIYARASEVGGLVDRYSLEPNADRPNLIVRVVDDDVWPFDEGENVASWSVIAVDLLDANDERSRRAGLELIERNQ